MKRIALLTVFFYCCTFAQPPQSHSAVPVALIAAAAIGASMAATSAGTYYAQTGQIPQYVKTASGAVATAADAVFQPSYLAQAVGALFTPQSLTTAQNYYAAKAAAVGASIADIVDQVRTSASGAYTSLKNLIEANSLPVSVNPSDFFVGVVLELTDGTFFEITQAPYAANYTTLTYFNNNGSTYPKSVYSTLIYATPSQAVFLDLNDTSVNSYGATTYRVWIAKGSLETKEPTYKPSPGVSYPGLADGLVSPAPEVASDLQQAIKDLPDAKKKIADAVPGASVDTLTEPTLTAAEVAQALKDNATSVAQAAATVAQEIVNSNADNATAQIAALQAAVTAAQSAANQSEPDPESEPNYPVPTSWYTPTCDLSDGLSSCINYEQILNASVAFQETALYQLPNLLLDCLGYVEGSGCEYPPKITVDLSSRFITDPMVLDMAPFDSVVKVMNFFFAILCIIGTGKAVMVLFS
ncbi:hypothetical protein Despr_0405 [Desulfobulbus propionicus DSM 2032]|uniref:Uncharacterized protein n=1 Tax=Desulfobulbus propionicus (strain ATCC 33891 / DSM 2032 / VKM B-1956 / 1pr3) TaxID=577650 RepID=A0A7U4DN58_DESPD|nr:hypothetical protein [Desulfobulbus propionicus]ADW16587.1 hypothetical protein Despr_0405 [Desulfobulbus propionicus DSM 2032]